ncbi:hypothetical protein C2G38_1151655 [Gigaspora rosea]|uniref:TLDc domain-containing protein n=1 Tax=Gigaspora rosea TaxID=44941 RepID=A0A397VLY8_9GLOM|nr:hypothetical protein C2G38_1151655 [Gigaspora rosea]
MVITCEFLFEELAKRLETYLIEANASWLRLHFSEVFQKSFQNNKFQELQNWCNNIIVKHPEKFFESEDFTSIQENTIISVIKRDDLQMEEVKILKHIIEWGIAQNPGMPPDPRNWSNDNFLTMKTTLLNCLPHIRYFQISSDDVIDYLQPYQQMLDKNLWDDIIKRLLSPNRPISSVILPPRVVLTQKLPPRTTEPFSTIINEAHAAEIISWIDKKADAYSATNYPYEFKLLLRGTRDGFTPASFWNLCDKQINIVVVAKIKGTDEILGGYNPIGWVKPITVSSIHMNCDESFIFSLKNGTIQNSILSRVKKSENAIWCRSECGPAFGGGSSACDLIFFSSDQQYWNCLASYEKRIRNASTYNSDGRSYFSVDEYEIFKISKKT